MPNTDWSRRVEIVRAHFERGGRRLSGETMMGILNDVVLGLPRAAISEKNGFTADELATVLGHVTTALQGGGKVRTLADGGWYEASGDAYLLADGFAAAWTGMRAGTSK
jgi:hypothetical protein